MSYVRKDYPTKKALKQAVAELASSPTQSLRRDLTIIPTSVVGDDPQNGQAYLEGPHYPRPHTWYAVVEVKDGVVIRVKS